MAYSNYFPNYYSQPMSPTPMSGTSNNGIIWVQGEAGAKSYLVAPNTTVQLWDSEKQVIYLKSADASGMPSMKILDYTFREQSQPHTEPFNSSKVEYITREEFEGLKRKIEGLMNKSEGDKDE